MDPLPTEILDNIVFLAFHQHNLKATWRSRVRQSHRSTVAYKAPGSFLPALAAVNKRFQEIVERYTFQDFSLCREDLRDFETVLKGNRGCCIHKIDLRIHLPHSKVLTEGSLRAERNEKTFTSAITYLFTIISAWESKTGLRGKIRLILGVRHRVSWMSLQEALGVFGIRHLDPISIPSVHSIVALSNVTSGASYVKEPIGTRTSSIVIMGGASRNRINSGTLAQLASRLPHLETFMLDSGLPPKTATEGTQLRTRRLLVEALKESYLLPSVKHLFLRLRDSSFGFYPRAGLEETYVTSRPDCADSLSECLRTLSLHLESLRIFGSVDESLFWPIRSIEAPYWHMLSTLCVEFSNIAPSGLVYFRGREDYSSLPVRHPGTAKTVLLDGIEHHRYSTRDWVFPVTDFIAIPEEEQLIPLVRAFANALQQMPKLELAILYSVVRLQRLAEMFRNHFSEGFAGLVALWAIVYAAPGVHISSLGNNLPFTDALFEGNASSRRLAMKTLDWQPDEILLLLRQTGQQFHADSLLESHGGLVPYVNHRTK